MQNDLLNYFGKSHAQYIHAKGEIGTSALIKALDCHSNEKILEIGFGTGATLVRLFSNNKKTEYYGLELSSLMYETARARLRFCLIGKSVKLSLISNKNQIPFESNKFDKIYFESVLGIQEGEYFKEFLLEIKRVLKPSGVLIMNETIWLDSTSTEEISRINKFCKQNFGIIQSSAQFSYLNDWISLLTTMNFKCESIIKLDEVKEISKSDFRFPYNFLSFTYTVIGKIKSLLKKSLWTERKVYFMKMNQIIPDDRQLMEGILFKARNDKPEL